MGPNKREESASIVQCAALSCFVESGKHVSRVRWIRPVAFNAGYQTSVYLWRCHICARWNVWLFHCAVVTIPVRSDGASTNRKSAHHGVMLLPLPACFLDEFLYGARYDVDTFYRLVSPSEISDRPCDPWRGHGVVSRRRYLFNTRCFARRAETRKCGCRRISGRRYLSLPL